MADLHEAVLLDNPAPSTRALHVYGPTRQARADAAADARQVFLTPHRIFYHWRPRTRIVMCTDHPLPGYAPERKWSIGTLAFVAACFTILGMVIYNVAVAS